MRDTRLEEHGEGFAQVGCRACPVSVGERAEEVVGEVG